MKRFGLSIAAASVLLLTSHAQAQINSAPPAGLLHVWSIPGAIQKNSLARFVACTNAGTANATVGVEVFGPTGTSLNNPTATQVVMAP